MSDAGQAGREPVTVLFDPRSPWCYQTSRWLRRLETLGEVELSWGVFSLEVVNLHAGEDAVGYEAEFGPGLRVALALREEHGQRAIGDFYAALGARMWDQPGPAGGGPAPGLAESSRLAVADIGIDPGYVDRVLTAEKTWTAVLDEHRRWAEELRVFGVPTLIFGRGADRSAVFGPVLRSLPDDETGRELWRHVRGLAGFDALYELKRFKPLQARADLPGAVWRADLRVADMRAARELMRPGGPCEHSSLEWAMARVRAARLAAARGVEE